MSNVYLCRINVEKHPTVLKHTDAPLIPSAPYRAGPKHREFEREEIGKMRKPDVAKLIVAEWPPPVAFVPGKDGDCNFVSIIVVSMRSQYEIGTPSSG